MFLDGVAIFLGGELDLCPPSVLLLIFALCLSSVKSVSVLPTLSATCTSTASFSSVTSSPSCRSSPSFQCMSPMKLRGTSYTMTRLLNVWNRRKPSCQRFCLRRMSWVYRQLNSRTGAVFWLGGIESEGVPMRWTAAVIAGVCWDHRVSSMAGMASMCIF